jgi:hypothetical protein
MVNKLKFLISLIVVLSIVFACSSNKSDKDKNNKTNQKQETSQAPKEQYRMAEMYDNDKTQMIDLIQGKAAFQIIYNGEGNFKANILKTDGTLLAVLADVNGSYKGKMTVDVPATTAYILDVHCKGQWSVYRE